MFSACSALASHKNEKSPLRECLCVGERGCKGCVLLLFTSRVKDTHPSATKNGGQVCSPLTARVLSHERGRFVHMAEPLFCR